MGSQTRSGLLALALQYALSVARSGRQAVLICQRQALEQSPPSLKLSPEEQEALKNVQFRCVTGFWRSV